MSLIWLLSQQYTCNIVHKRERIEKKKRQKNKNETIRNNTDFFAPAGRKRSFMELPENKGCKGSKALNEKYCHNLRC
jgi:hypothetical protein